jgi:hypothetical protein
MCYFGFGDRGEEKKICNSQCFYFHICDIEIFGEIFPLNRWTVPIVPFYKRVVTSVGQVFFFKDTHWIRISQKIKTSSSSFFGPIPGQGIKYFVFLSTLVLIELVFINLRPIGYPQLVLSNQL